VASEKHLHRSKSFHAKVLAFSPAAARRLSVARRFNAGKGSGSIPVAAATVDGIGGVATPQVAAATVDGIGGVATPQVAAATVDGIGGVATPQVFPPPQSSPTLKRRESLNRRCRD
jgi:hypothetical protein